MTLNDANMRAVSREAQYDVNRIVNHFRDPSATWDTFGDGSNEAWLELLKTHLVALAGQVQTRINEVTISTPEDFG